MKVHPPRDSYSFLSRTISFFSIFGIVLLLSAVYLDWKVLWDLRLLAAFTIACAGLLITFSFGRLARISRLVLCYMVVGVLLWLQASVIAQDNRVFFGLPLETITHIDGRLVADSVLSVHENQVLSLALHRCDSKDGSSADAHGTLLAIGGRHDLLPSGTNLSLSGSLVTLEDGNLLFLTESIEVLVPPQPWLLNFRTVRKRLLLGLLHRFEPLESGPAELCGLLLLGRTDEEGSSIKQLSVESGCAHILALSGMHLQFFAGATASIVALFLGKRRGKKLAVFPVILFLTIAGPKPSLIRSAFMYLLGLDSQKHCSARNALMLACAVQLFAFPRTIATLGCLLSYSSLAGMLLFQGVVSQALQRLFPRWLAVVFSTSLGAVVFSGPCALVVFGCWHPIGMFLAPVVAPLAFICMGLGLVWLLIPIPLMAYCLQQVYNLFMFLLSSGATWSRAHPLVGSSGYLCIYLAVLLTVVGFLLYACQIARTRSTYRHEMGLSLRFPECNHRVVG